MAKALNRKKGEEGEGSLIGGDKIELKVMYYKQVLQKGL